MKKRPFLNLVTAFCLLSLSSFGCASLTPFIQDFNIVSVEQENQLSEQLHAQIQKEMKLVQTPSRVNKVNAIGENIVATMGNQPFDYKFYVVEDPSPNAFAIPGARIYIHTGLMDFVGSDDELAGVIGHEIGHAYERHPAKSLSRAFGLDFVTQKLFKTKDSQGTLKTLTIGFIQNGFLSRYGRDDEREADDLGVDLMKKAGYRPDGLLDFLRRLESLEKPGSQPPAFLSSHPPTPERIERLEQISAPGSITSTTTQRY